MAQTDSTPDTMTRKQTQSARKRKVSKAQKTDYLSPQGYRCECESCLAGSSPLYPSRDYCGLCGHGYLITGHGFCSKCGGQQWVEVSPDLPVAPRKRYRVEMVRTVTQRGTLIVSAISALGARLKACDINSEVSNWQQIDASAGYGDSAQEVN